MHSQNVNSSIFDKNWTWKLPLLLAFFLFINNCYSHWDTARDYFLDTDDAMRLMQIRDWMGGQSWFELKQYRINGESGWQSHWSRVVDLPVALLTLLMQMFFKAPLAEQVAGFIWVGILYLSLMLIMMTIGRKLHGSSGLLIATLLSMTNFPGLSQFMPGRIDHHNLQIILVMVGYACLLTPSKHWGGALLAFVSVLSLNIGTEALPIFVIAGTIVCLEWVFGTKNQEFLRSYALSLALSAFATHLLLKGANFESVCDAYGLNYSATLMFLGILLVGATYFAQTKPVKGVSLGLIGALSIVLFYHFNDACIKGPYAQIDPRIIPIWLANVKEAQPFIKVFDPNFSYIHYLSTFNIFTFTLAATCLILKKSAPRLYIISFVLFCVPFALGFVQMRWFTFSAWLAVPLLVICIHDLQKKFHSLQHLRLILLGIFNPVLTTLLAVSFLMPPSISHSEQKSACMQKSAFVTLNNIKTGRIFAHEDLGPFILVQTKHSAVAGPYHRLGEAIFDTYAFFGAPAKDAKTYAHKWKADYVLVCKYEDVSKSLEGGLKKQLHNKTPPKWLTPIDLPVDTPFLLYKVLP